ncbi:MAG: hypothetical protein IH965_07625 [Gemmatimonadetes bacterium]|nr:hypothetical protein [Gemmatimonadota bacterium]
MRRKRVAVIVSDFHIGQGDRLDSFKYDKKLLRFCSDLRQYVDREGVELTLVMNGDMLDLWAIVPAAEVLPGAVRRLTADLEFPARTPRARQKAVRRGKRQITAAFRAHPAVARAVVGLLLQPRTRLVYLPGNHDHAMVHPDLQDHFRTTISRVGGSDVGARIEFELYYEDPDLGLYVEHGNQFSEDSDYNRFDVFDEEAAGFYFLRFVWNRIRASYRFGDRPFTEALGWMLNRTFGGAGKQPQALKFFLEYFEAFDSGIVPFMPPQPALQAVYREWKAQGRKLEPDDLLVAALAQVFTRAKRKHRKFERKPPGAPPGGISRVRSIGLPGRTVPVNWGAHVDEYWEGAMSMFTGKHDPFPRLSRQTYATIVLGHTHRRRYVFLPAKDARGGRYINSGSWTKDKKPTYVWVSDGGDPREWRGLKQL